MTNEHGSKVWLIVVRVMAFATPLLFSIFWWWFKSVTVMAIETRQTAAILQTQVVGIKDDLKDIKGLLERHLEQR